MKKYKRISEIVYAEKLTEPTRLDSLGHIEFGNKDDWLIVDGNDCRCICPAYIFKKIYELIGGDENDE